MMLVAPCIPFPFFTPCDAMLTMFFCATHWLSIYLYMLSYMFMHESCLLVCHPYFNTMKSWTSDPNLHLSPVDTTFCFPFCFFVFYLVCLLACPFAFLLSCLTLIFACHVSHHMLCLPYLSCLSAYTLCALSMHLFLSIAYMMVSCSCLCMYTHGARTHGAKARSSKHKQKRARVKACRYKPSDNIQ